MPTELAGVRQQIGRSYRLISNKPHIPTGGGGEPRMAPPCRDVLRAQARHQPPSFGTGLDIILHVDKPPGGLSSVPGNSCDRTRTYRMRKRPQRL
jgi:hypothetical protein